MKIVLISNLFPPNSRGGAEVVAKQVVDGLKDRQHEVVVITTCPFNGIKTLFPNRQEDVYRFYPLNIFYYLNDFKHSFVLRFIWNILDVFNIHSYWTIRKILKDEKPDIVLSHCLKGLGYLTSKAIRHEKVKHIHTLHDIQLDNPSGTLIWKQEKDSFNSWSATRYYSKINQFLFKDIDIVISPSKYLLNYYTEKNFFTESQKRVLRNPVIFDQINSQKGKWSEMNYLYLGQIEKHKGIEFLLGTFLAYIAELDDYLDHKLHVVGDGVLLDEMKMRYGAFPEIIFHGRVPHENIQNFFEQMDFLIFPSLCYENSPTVITESLSYGIPVIVSDIGGSAELVKNGINGFIFPPGDIRELLQILHYAKDHLPEIEKMKEQSRGSIKHLSCPEYFKIIESLMN